MQSLRGVRFVLLRGAFAIRALCRLLSSRNFEGSELDSRSVPRTTFRAGVVSDAAPIAALENVGRLVPRGLGSVKCQ